MPSIIFNTNRNNIDIVAKGKLFPSLKEFFMIGLTFGLTVIAWIIFRSRSLLSAFEYIRIVFSKSFFHTPYFPGINLISNLLALIVLFIMVEWIGREEHFALKKILNSRHWMLKWSMYYLIVLLILWFSGQDHEFIYFQF